MAEVWELQKENYGQPFRACFDDLVNGQTRAQSMTAIHGI
jgi:hypothetical protein